MRRLARASAVACLWLLSVQPDALPAGAGDGSLRGSLDLDIRGPGAAALGIASAIVGSTDFGFNLARLQTLAAPTAPLPANETYGGSARFTLVPVSSKRWVLDELTIDYQLVDSTVLDYGEGVISDSMSDQGNVRWKRLPGARRRGSTGRWQGPPGWEPELDPRIVLELFKAPSAAQCEDPEARGLFNLARQLLFDTSGWATCYELEVFVMHPIRASGRSTWRLEPMEISLDAADGRLRFAADAGFDLDDAQLPDAVPPEAKEFFKMVRGLQDRWRNGFAEFDADLEMAWERKYTGALLSRIHHAAIYSILSGATVVEELEVPFVELYLEKTKSGWRPEAEGNGEPAQVTIASLPGSEPIPVRITLFDVTSEKGTCLNSQDDGEDLDLWVHASQNSALFKRPEKKRAGWVVETRRPVTEAVLEVEPRDFGAWGRVRAEGKFGDIWVTLAVKDSELSYTTLPLDEKGGENYIADDWEETWGAPGADPTTDDDLDPIAASNGDGISLYEEYRGFYVEGSHSRTRPTTKNLFIHFQPGSGLAAYADSVGTATGLDVKRIEANEFVDVRTRVINPNRGRFSVTEQHGLYAIDWYDPDPGTSGYADCVREEPGRPKDCRRILVSVGALDREVTLIHEVLHAVDVWHHGEGDDEESEVCKIDGAYYPLATAADCTGRGGAPARKWVAHQEGQHSGDQECVMAYHYCADFWRTQQGTLATRDDGTLADFQEVEAKSSHLCGNPRGTHFNSDGKQVGDAHRGACRVQIWVSDE